jgi:hypothetical protein
MSTSSPYDSAGYSGKSQGFDDPVEIQTEDEDDEYLDEEAIWTPAQKALPPVFGRYDKDSGERLMHYSDDVIQSANKDDEFDWQDSEGTSIDIGF